MEICDNKKTGQVFVHLDRQDEDKALMITPNGIVMALAYDLFTEPVEVEDGDALANGIINRAGFHVRLHIPTIR